MMKNNELIEKMVDAFIEEGTNELFATLVEALIDTEVILINNDLDGTNLKKFGEGAITPLVITDSQKKNYIPLFTRSEQIINDEIKKKPRVNYVFKDLCNDSIIKSDYLEGYVLNPFTQGLKLPKELINIVIKYNKENVQ